MKKLILTLALAFASFTIAQPLAYAYNFGDFRSETLIKKAWSALEQGDLEGVLAYTNKNVELYGEQAKEMQESLDGYVEGENEDVFAYWALNDVATGLFIQAEAFRKANMIDEAKDAYSKIINEYTYGQTWDSKGWFWKPAEAAKEKMAILESGKDIDFGDYSSQHLTNQAWAAFSANDPELVSTYVDKNLELYQDEAEKMQSSLDEYPWESKEKIFSYWALNDVGTALYIKGEALKQAGDLEGAKKAYQALVDDYYYAQCWDPKGWFWKPAEAAQQALDELES